MVNVSPPSISFSGADDKTSRLGLLVPHMPITPMTVMGQPSNLISPAPSFNDSLNRDKPIVSPYNSTPLEPQILSLQGDVFNLLSDFFQENDLRSGAFEASDPVNLSLLLLSTHSAAAAMGSNTGRRARSGSLFSTHSIWNDDILPNNSPDRSVSSGGGILDLFPDLSIPAVSSSKPGSSSFISPNLVPQNTSFGFVNQSRNRSHTTSGLMHGPVPPKTDTFRSNLSPLLHSSQEDPSSAIDNLYLNSNEYPIQATRNRSQTYSGAHPKISNSALPGMSQGTPAQNYGAPQNVSGYQNGTSLHPLQQSQPVTDSSLTFSNLSAEPFLQDDFNFFELLVTTNFETPSLGPTNTLLLDNVPPFLDASRLYQLLSNPTGVILGLHNRGVLSVRVALAGNSKMALVVCPSVEVAMNLKANFNHLEIVPGNVLYVAFAKVAEKMKSMAPVGAPSSNPPQGISQQNFSQINRLPPASKSEPEPVKESVPLPENVDFATISESVLATCFKLSGPLRLDYNKISSIIDHAIKFPKSKYETKFGALPEPAATRQFDAPKIRELRKSLEANEKILQKQQTTDSEEANVMSQTELESLAVSMLEELPELSYDHIGNTIVQKMFTVLESSDIKLRMVKAILPYLAQLGIHKNGTWAIQKIINLSQDQPEQKKLIAESLRPYSAKLFNDQFGNYVLQCCLKFESPYNDFIFEAICNNFVEISSGRFGVRCIRTILETLNDCKSPAKSPVSKEQLVLVSGLIVEYANDLVVNNNGSLLITWFLDTYHGLANYIPDERATLLYEKLLPRLDKLCMHKLANVTVFKLLNNRTDASVRQKILDSIFLTFSDSDFDQLRPPTRMLESLLKESTENNAGPMFIQKVISNACLFDVGDDDLNHRYQQFATNQVKRVLLEMQISNLQPYKKLLDEVGLSNAKLGRATSSRKSKRGTGTPRNGQVHPSYEHGMSSFQQMPPGHQMPIPVGYNNFANEQLFYTPYAPMGHSGMPINGTPAGYASQYYDNNVSMNNNQDAHVMRQLEQLSLQSAAMGYASNPGTPGVGSNHQNQNLFF